MNLLIKCAAVVQAGIVFATIFAWPHLFPVALIGLIALWVAIMPEDDDV